uniref:Uncharacterized protein n=1 Tax=Cyanothece sp. (strain PCC 7425 / ATCC 29141) TaxID=395961 RepID=B8HNV8_CYAP4
MQAEYRQRLIVCLEHELANLRFPLAETGLSVGCGQMSLYRDQDVLGANPC